MLKDTQQLLNCSNHSKGIFLFSQQERKIYNKWRIRILLSVILGYATFYLCRQNFSMIMPAFMEEFGYTKTQLGALLTISSIVYGIGKFINGYLSDRSNARYFMPFALFCSGIITFFLGFSQSLVFLGSFWIINNWFQSMGWPPVAKMLAHWFAAEELGRKWSYAAASHQIGGALTLVFTSYLVSDFGWRIAFFIPAIIALIVSYLLFNRLRESPRELGFPSVELYKNQLITTNDGDKQNKLPTIKIIKQVFISKDMWYICFANMFLYIVRLGVILWAPLFLREFKNISINEAGLHVAAYEMTGFFGGIVAGATSDKIFCGQRGPIGALFMIALACVLYAFWQIPTDYLFLNRILMMSMGFCVYGPQVLAGVASTDIVSKKAIGIANGLVGAMGYIGSAVSGVCVGLISDKWGWNAVFVFFIASSLLGGMFFYLTWKKT